MELRIIAGSGPIAHLGVPGRMPDSRSHALVQGAAAAAAAAEPASRKERNARVDKGDNDDVGRARPARAIPRAPAAGRRKSSRNQRTDPPEAPAVGERYPDGHVEDVQKGPGGRAARGPEGPREEHGRGQEHRDEEQVDRHGDPGPPVRQLQGVGNVHQAVERGPERQRGHERGRRKRDLPVVRPEKQDLPREQGRTDATGSRRTAVNWAPLW